jgi:hypothetical protein
VLPVELIVRESAGPPAVPGSRTAAPTHSPGNPQESEAT